LLRRRSRHRRRGVKVDLHGFTIGGSKTPGSGIRNDGYAGLQVVGVGWHAAIQGSRSVLVSHGANPSISDRMLGDLRRPLDEGGDGPRQRPRLLRGRPGLDTCPACAGRHPPVDSDRALVPTTGPS
jgi:hypothetical protein